MTDVKRRHNKGAWKRIYGTDRRYTARVDRAMARGQYTEAGTPSNPPKERAA